MLRLEADHGRFSYYSHFIFNTLVGKLLKMKIISSLIILNDDRIFILGELSFSVPLWTLFDKIIAIVVMQRITLIQTLS